MGKGRARKLATGCKYGGSQCIRAGLGVCFDHWRKLW